MALSGCGKPASSPPPASPAKSARAPYQSAEACQSCHPVQYADWLKSHHAAANRPVDPVLDAAPFAQETTLQHGSITSTMRRVDGRIEIVTKDLDGQYVPMQPEAVIGIDPLIQYLVPFPNGRLQSFSLAYDVHSNEWFDIFSGEDRQPHEWGFWGGRGMNWNAQCASCHMTGYDKGYEVKTDRYHTTWDAQGIQCAQCHGAMTDHINRVKNGTYAKPSAPDPV
ncbi:MAG TPA: multiheme c-type cytochrome, partial [Nitrospiria bacterium]|nr:multiheme c-type cytochrome [Nitrospiria bacterium]